MNRFGPFLLALTVTASWGVAQDVVRPNFLWLISEDNSKHFLRLFDPSGAPTPRIAELAKEGFLFEHAFSNSPVCSVARTTLMTSCYAPRIGTQYHRRSQLAPLPDGVQMFPKHLRGAGYYTTNKRKKDYNAVEGRGVWDESSGKANWRNRAAGQPFFHMESFTATHESSLHFSAKKMARVATKTDPKSVTLAPYHPDTPTFRYTYASYHDRIQQVDQQIGKVVDRLAADGLLEDTFIFYFGDHGGVLPRGKGYAYESGLHVPLVVRIPTKWRHLIDGKPGMRIKGFVSFVDFGPTLLRLAGIKDPQGIDGRPFLGKGVQLSELNSRDEAFGYADRFDEKCDLVRSLRKGRFKYLRSYQPFNFDGLQNNYRYKMLAYTQWRRLYRQGTLNSVQRQFFEPRAAEALYDLDKDPHETENLASQVKYFAVVGELRGRLAAKVKSISDLSMFPESYLLEAGMKSPTKFGQARKQEIARLVSIADLSLLPFDEAKPAIESALVSKQRWERYWALICCSSHGQAAACFEKQAAQLIKTDPERMVRVRAAEFLGLIGKADPSAAILAALRESESPEEANLILNTLVLLRDGQPGYEFRVTEADVKHAKKPRSNVQRRLDYLSR